MKPVFPPATLGILGSGQLGRMLAFETKRMGYTVHVFSPGRNTPAGQVSDLETSAAYEDIEAVLEFARNIDVVTVEFENIPVETLQGLEQHVPVHPSPEVLHTAQNRGREKAFLLEYGFPIAPYALIGHEGELEGALRTVGTPAVLKTAGFGYDGKGQRRVASLEELREAYASLGSGAAVLEAFIEFDREISVVAARTQSGEFAHYGVLENLHAHHILDITSAPPTLPDEVMREAVETARGVLEALNVVGVMCVEFFLTGSCLSVNELAPRPHNSGHLTIEGCVTSQFEQQLRAVCGLPLGSSEFLRPAAMANLLGDLWEGGTPLWENVLAEGNIHLHLYGKAEARPGRKMGHLTALGTNREEAVTRVQEARARLKS